METIDCECHYTLLEKCNIRPYLRSGTIDISQGIYCPYI